MKFKYYLRGIGIGIFVTTLIFAVSIAIHSHDNDVRQTAQQESKTVAELQTEQEQNTERIPADTQETVDAEQSVQTETAASEEPQTPEPDTQEPAVQEPQADDSAAGTPPDTAEPEPSQTTDENTNTNTVSAADDATDHSSTDSQEQTTETVHFEIKGGEYSDSICRRLQKDGLIDDAGAFNKYLIGKKYDNLILPGSYDIPKGATYDEIAALLTRK